LNKGIVIGIERGEEVDFSWTCGGAVDRTCRGESTSTVAERRLDFNVRTGRRNAGNEIGPTEREEKRSRRSKEKKMKGKQVCDEWE
jgi:hypothetical protein